MGLDSIELVMEVEESFGITIPDEDAAGLRTVGDLYHLVLLKLPGRRRPPDRCASATTFYRLRRTLISRFGVERDAVRPGSVAEGLIPKSGRRAAWSEFAQETRWTLPPLERPLWLREILLVGLLLVQSIVPLALWVGLFRGDPVAGFSVAMLWLLPTTPLLVFVGERLTRPLAVRLPANCATVGDLVRLTMQHNYREIGAEVGYRPDEVWEALRQVIADLFVVPPELIDEDSRFAEDLGLG